MNSTDPHLTRAEIAHILDNARHPDPSAEAANAHLQGCEQCRRALRSQAPAVEARLIRLFSQMESADLEAEPNDSIAARSEWMGSEWPENGWKQVGGTEDEWSDENATCIAQEDMFRYVADELPASEITQVEAHLQECRLCRREVRELRELHNDAEALVQSLAAPIVASPQSTPSAADPVPATSHPELDPAASAEAPTVDTSPADTKTTAWQRWREKWLPNSVLAPKFLFPLATGAVCTASVLVIGFWLLLRQSLYAQDKSFALQVKVKSQEAADLKARLQAERETARQRQTQLAQVQEDLLKAQQKLKTMDGQQNQNPLDGAVLLGQSASGDQLYQDKQGVFRRSQPVAANLSKALLHPETALADGRTQLDAVASKLEKTMGSGQDTTPVIELLAPISRIVSSSTPRFQWRSLNGSSHYQVQIREEKTGIELPENKPITATTWTPTKALHPSITYLWQVVATNDKGEETARSVNGRFKVLDTQTAARIDSLTEFPLARGLLYVQAGMPDEAEREWKRLPETDRRLSLARTLQQHIRALRQSSK